MSDLPFVLEAHGRFGSSRYVATFAKVSDLWAFYGVWRAGAGDDEQRAARFLHVGRMVRSVTPSRDEDAALQWAGECVERDKRAY